MRCPEWDVAQNATLQHVSSSPRGVVADLSEDQLLALVLPLLAGPRHEPVGPGDDAAVLDVTGQLVASTDAMVRGRDWRDEWSTPEHVAAKAVIQNLADIAAMGARPTSLLCTVVMEPQTSVDWVLRFARALGEQCRRYDVSVAGGDLSSAPPGTLIISITAFGELDGRPVLRSGAQPGDLVAVSGPIGRSAVGLDLLEAATATGTDPTILDPHALAHHRAPTAPLSQGPAAAGAQATAMMDISDGLSRDGARIARASGVRLALESAALAPDLNWAEEHLPRDRARWCVLHGGEEHSLLATFPPQVGVPTYWRAIGRVEALPDGTTPGVLLDGRPLPESGWDHFHTASG